MGGRVRQHRPGQGGGRSACTQRRARTAKPGTHGAIQVGLSVDQPLEEVVQDLQARGVVFRGPIVDDVQVRLAFFGDPDGNDCI